jgi:AAA domain
MTNTIVYLIGFPGSGKYTIAEQIRELTGAKLVDNHLINNPVFSVIDAGGVNPIPDPAWQKVAMIRRIVLDTIRELSSPHFSFVFTNHLVDGDAADVEVFAEIAALAAERRSRFVPVRLFCDEEELCRRIASADRIRRFKDISPDNAHHTFRTRRILRVDHPHLLDLDVTKLTAAQAALRIVRHVQEAER